MADANDTRHDLSWRKANRHALIVLCILYGAAMAWIGSSGRVDLPPTIPVFPGRVEAAAEKIDPNTASAASLRRLHPLGPVRAAAIVEYRKSHGPVAFRTLADLDNVPGLGMATIGQFQEHLSLPDGVK